MSRKPHSNRSQGQLLVNSVRTGCGRAAWSRRPRGPTRTRDATRSGPSRSSNRSRRLKNHGSLYFDPILSFVWSWLKVFGLIFKARAQTFPTTLFQMLIRFPTSDQMFAFFLALLWTTSGKLRRYAADFPEHRRQVGQKLLEVSAAEFGADAAFLFLNPPPEVQVLAFPKNINNFQYYLKKWMALERLNVVLVSSGL